MQTKGRLHFDVFIPTDKSQSTQMPKEIDSEAVGYAKEFLTLIGKPSEDLAVNMCERCHIDNTDLYASELWKLPGKEIFIWPMEGCPKPSKNFFGIIIHFETTTWTFFYNHAQYVSLCSISSTTGVVSPSMEKIR